MNEERFRALMREAVGEEQESQWLSQAVRTRLGQPETRSSRARWFAVVAASIALAVLAVAIAPRLMHRAPSTTPGVFVTPTSVYPWNCTLPVIVDQEAGYPPMRVGPGFVNTRTGEFSIDASASTAVNQLPSDQLFVGPPSASEARYANTHPQVESFSSAARKWLPVTSDRISPDGMSYVYLIDYGEPMGLFHQRPRTLMRYDISTGESVKVWASGVPIAVLKWTTTGILVNEVEDAGPVWSVDPRTGTPTQVRWPYRSASQATPPGGDSWRLIGLTDAGEEIAVTSTFGDPAAPSTVFYDTVSGTRVYIYQGPPANFDPGFSLPDADGFWFSTFSNSLTIWHWSKRNGLGKLTVGLPAGAALSAEPVGGCF